MRQVLLTGDGRVGPVGLALLGLGALIVALPPFLTPNSYSNLYLSDALYLLNAGYLMAHGSIPHVDFGWQFGGYEAGLIAVAIHLFGPSMRALDQAIAFGYAISVVLLFVTTARRARPWTLILLLFLLTAVALTRFPFELVGPDIAVQSYAMFYNRICWCLTIAVFAPLLVSDAPLTPAALVAGALAVFLIVLTKPTFAVTLPLALPLLLRANGWRGAVFAAAALLGLAAAAWALFGFGPVVYWRLVPDMLDAAQDILVIQFGPVSKLAHIVFFHFIELATLAITLGWVAYRGRRARAVLIRIAASTLLLGLSLVATVFTGSFGFIAATTPMIAFVAIVLIDVILAGDRDAAMPVAVAGLSLFVIAFAGPYFLNYTLGMVKQVTRGDQAVFTAGPLAGLIVDRPDSSATPQFRDDAEADAYLARRTRFEGGIRWMGDYEWQYLLKDGLELIGRVPGSRQLRIVSFSPAVFPFAAAAAPVPDFPLYPGIKSPSMLRLSRLPADVDAVMVLRGDDGNKALARLKPSIAREFHVAARSRFWDLYRR